MLRVALLAISLTAATAWADDSAPTADIPNAADSPLLEHYEGSYIVSYEQHAFNELSIPLSPLKPTETAGETDAHNNRLHRPLQSIQTEGKVTRLVYVLPENRSPLEALRNYQDVITAKGGEVTFECKGDECGGDPTRASSGGGGRMSLMQYFFYEKSVKDRAFSNGACALTSRIDDQRFLAAKRDKDGLTTWFTVQTYQIAPSTYCKQLHGRTVALVHIVEPKARENNMVVVKAEQMSNAIESDGSISLYGIFFDTNEAKIKPESEPTLSEIASLLASQPDMAVLVVGHTDNQGSYEHNLSLSARRAEAVKQALVTQHGVEAKRMTTAGAGMMAPIATNATEEGRAKNRRVALVKAN